MGIYGLDRIAGQRAGSMSGGQRQRLALAAATLHRPKLLFLDEPTSAVDPETRREFWEQLFDLVDAGASILVSTHFMDEAERCHRLAILEAGHKRADGTPKQLMKNMGANAVDHEGDDPYIGAALRTGKRRGLVNTRQQHGLSAPTRRWGSSRTRDPSTDPLRGDRT